MGEFLLDPHISKGRTPDRPRNEMSGTPITNAALAELLFREAEREEGHRVRALRRASRAAMFWPEEASSIAERGGDLTALPSVGSWVNSVMSRMSHDDTDSPPNVYHGRKLQMIASAAPAIGSHIASGEIVPCALPPPPAPAIARGH